MPSNPHQPEMMCWREIYSMYDRMKRLGTSVAQVELVHQCIRMYPVSKDAVKKHLKEFYFDTGKMVLEDGELRVVL